MAVSRDSLEEQFAGLGVDVTDSVLEKCEELCTTYELDEEALVETWMAFSLTHLGGSDPTLDTLVQMERKELVKPITPLMARPRASQTLPSPLRVYNASHFDSSLTKNDDILEAYNTYTTPKAKRTKPIDVNDDVEYTPETTTAVRAHTKLNTPGRSPLTAFSPASYSSCSQPSQRYSERSNAGEVKFHLGPACCSWKPNDGLSFLPKIAPNTPDSTVKTNALYMFEKISDEVALHNQQIEYLSQQIMDKHSLTDPEPCSVPFQERVVTCGRIMTEKQLSVSTQVLLQGSLALSNGRVVELDVSAVEECHVFPGQVVVVEGSNPTGNLIYAERIYTSANLPLPRDLPNFTSREGLLELVVAAGPFTQLDSLNYQPLEDLIKYVVEHKPHVVILIGPFIDASHPRIKDEMLAETFEAHFEKMIEKIMEPCKGMQTQVVMIPSWRDVHSESIYPTLPFAPRKPPANMHFMSDPSTISIQGLVVGVTSLDVIKDLSANELSRSSGTVPRLHRLASHLLAQQCFYPLYPPPLELHVDAELFNLNAHMDVTPHILILPSELRYFAAVLGGCLVLNPQRLTRGMIGGTFARLEIPPPASGDCQAFIDNISCDIVSI